MSEVRYEFEEGRLLVFKRTGSRFWQTRMRVDGEYVFKSLKTTDEHKAIVTAKEWFNEQGWAKKHGLPTKVRYMRDLIDDFQKWVDERLKAKMLSTHMAYLYKLQSNGIIREFFGDKQVHAIKDDQIAEYIEWRMGCEKKPARQTLTMELQTLRKVFELAVRKNLIMKGEAPAGKIPKMSHLKAETRPAFTREEERKLYELMDKWVASTNHASIGYRRRLMRAYVQIMLTTGMRTNDAKLLKWKHISKFGVGGSWFTEIVAYGKATAAKPSRMLTGQPHATRFIRFWNDDSKFTNPDDYVFCYSKGVQWDPKTMFKDMLTEFGMLKDPITGDNRTPYSLRHAYATIRLEAGIPIHLLAKQMGTSVGMIEKHYGHVNLKNEVHKLARNKAGFLDVVDVGEVWADDDKSSVVAPAGSIYR